MRKLLYVAVAFTALASLTGCKSTKKAPVKLSPGMADALAGTPQAETVRLWEVLKTQLTEAELNHLIDVDWGTLSMNTFFQDPVLIKAFGVIEAEGSFGSVGLQPSSKSYAPGVACPNTDCQRLADSGDSMLKRVGEVFKQKLLDATLPAVTFKCAATALAVVGTGGAATLLLFTAGMLCVEGVISVGRAVKDAILQTSAGVQCFVEQPSQKDGFSYTLAATAETCKLKCAFPPFTVSCGGGCLFERAVLLWRRAATGRALADVRTLREPPGQRRRKRMN